MDELQLTETEKRYFSDLFVCCDFENTGKVPQTKAFELFRSGNVSTEVLKEMSDICGIKTLIFNRTEFYSFLKLIAAFQANVALNAAVLTSAVELPLPRFTWPATEEVAADSTDSASDSPTPTNSVQERNWAVGTWCEEQRQLLGTEEESSDRHSSDEDQEIAEEVWIITPEQREYYRNQFKLLQPDVGGFLAGGVARKFFEKSMLPVEELRKIWQLSDVTKDGKLDLEEFLTAMHLVVLRRNHITLPQTLPAPLLGGAQRPPSPQNLQSPQTKETWTKFIDSPTGSPGPKPVCFDFQKGAVAEDPKILHPKPLRLTPEISQATTPPEGESIINPIQRPQPKKPPFRGAIPPPPPTQLEEQVVPKKPPPPPPPRPFKTHGRSSSLDLNRLKNGGGAPPPPPRISPNISLTKKLIIQRSEDSSSGGGGGGGLDNNDEEKYENFDSSGGQEPRRHGAFEIYRKPPVAAFESPLPAAPPPTEDSAKYELYKKLKEQNLVLLRLCQELSQELADVREERTTLRLRLEQQSATTTT